MPVNLSIKSVPDDLADRLRKRAEQNRRSLQRELLVILEEAEPKRARKLTVRELAERVRELGIKTPSESVRWVRQMRDER